MSEQRKVPKLRFPEFTDDWEQCKVSEIAETTFGGGTPKTSNDSFWIGNIPWIQSSDLTENILFDVVPKKHISQEAIDKSATKLVPKNSVAIVTRVGVGKLAFMPFSYATSQDFLSLSKLKTEPQFTVYVLYKKLQSELNAVQGTSIKGITKDELLTKVLMIPCYEEQDKIGRYLHFIDNLITLHQRKCEVLKKLKKGLLQKMFPKDGTNIPEIRFPEFTDAWEQHKLNEITSRVQGNNGRLNLQTLTISAGNGWMKQEDRFSANIAGKEQKNYTLLKQGELAYNHGNSKLAKYGAVFELKDFDEALVPRVYHSFRVNNKTNSSFIEYLFATKILDKELGKLVSSGARMDGLLNIGYEDFVSIKITVPSFEEQQKIASYFRKVDEIITLHQRKLEVLKKLKKGLLQQMFV